MSNRAKYNTKGKKPLILMKRHAFKKSEDQKYKTYKAMNKAVANETKDVVKDIEKEEKKEEEKMKEEEKKIKMKNSDIISKLSKLILKDILSENKTKKEKDEVQLVLETLGEHQGNEFKGSGIAIE